MQESKYNTDFFTRKFNFTYNDSHRRILRGLSIFSLISIDWSEKVV